MHELYRQKYVVSRFRLLYYDVPIIVLSAVSSVFIAGAEGYLDKTVVQVTTCVMSLLVGVIGALKKLLKIDENREQCLETYKDLFRLFCELSMVLDMPPSTRPGDPQQYATETANRYSEIMQRSLVLEERRVMKNPIYDDTHPLPKEKERAVLRRIVTSASLEGVARTPSPSV